MMSYKNIGLQQIASLSANAHNACDFQTLLVMRLATDNELDDHKTLDDSRVVASREDAGPIRLRDGAACYSL
jgi:hypothetical protein